MDNLIEYYYTLGFNQKEILLCLVLLHNITISERTLRRKLKQRRLYRKKNFTNIDLVVRFIENQLERHGQLHGYRWLHLKCIQSGLVVTQEAVRLILHQLDPHGVEMRRRKRLRRRQYYCKGPNYLWHIDCYDKLKRFGICINGCIDGFSRNIIWLEAGNNTNNPAIIANYFLKNVEKLGGCPHTVRTDMGTENGLIEHFQALLRSENEEGNSLPSFIYGSSPANQRIEAWWGILRKHHAQFWMNLFHSLKDQGLFSGTYVDKALIQFCFLKLIQEELENVVLEWNTHRISSSRNSVSPKGRPFVMYNCPEVYGTGDYLRSIDQEDFNICKQASATAPDNTIPCDSDIYELALIVMSEKNLRMPTDPNSAVDLYVQLRSEFLLYF